MRFLIDVDGVAADLIGFLLGKLHSEFGNIIKPEEMTDWDILDAEKTVLAADVYCRAVELMNQPGGNNEYPLIPGAVEGYNKIVAAGHEAMWLTSSWRDCPTWEYDRRNWIKKHFGSHKYDIAFYHNKWQVSGDILIDDKIENIVRWKEEQGGRGLLYDQPWNRTAPNTIERFTWADIDNLLGSL